MSRKRSYSKKRSARKSPQRKVPIIISQDEKSFLLEGTKNGPLLGGHFIDEMQNNEMQNNEMQNGENIENIKGGTILQLPKLKTWSWTQFNKSVTHAVDNMLYWKPQFKKYFITGAFIVGAYKSNASRFFNERNVVEIALNPREDFFTRKLILTFIISVDNKGEKYYSASADEVPIKAPSGYHIINKQSDVLSYFRTKDMA